MPCDICNTVFVEPMEVCNECNLHMISANTKCPECTTHSTQMIEAITGNPDNHMLNCYFINDGSEKICSMCIGTLNRGFLYPYDYFHIFDSEEIQAIKDIDTRNAIITQNKNDYIRKYIPKYEKRFDVYLTDYRKTAEYKTALEKRRLENHRRELQLKYDDKVRQEKLKYLETQKVFDLSILRN